MRELGGAREGLRVARGGWTLASVFRARGHARRGWQRGQAYVERVPCIVRSIGVLQRRHG
jgi:hypothetical protein